MSGFVALVGAGPGDPGLLTRRGAELIAAADVVVHDRLVSPQILALAAHAELIGVGKTPGGPSVTQDEINAVLIREACRGRRVVRLKGGDPFVFGRGGEECEALATAQIRFEVVPGVTSAVAAPAAVGIPLTHRERASWAVLATGHGTQPDFEVMAAAPTSAFLMPVGRLPSITKALRDAGKPSSTPAAVIASATLPAQRCVVSTLGRIAAEAAHLPPPAVLIVGDTVCLASLRRGPLAGARVMIVRTREQAGRLSSLVREFGGVPIEVPAIRIGPASDTALLDAAAANLGRYSWVAFTSANAVDAVASALGRLELDARAFYGVRVAAVGEATAAKLRGIGLRADLVPSIQTCEALAAALGTGKGLILLPRGEGDPPPPEFGWDIDAVPAYSKHDDESGAALGRQALDAGIDAVALTSGSAAAAFARLWGLPDAAVKVCCIGPQTAAAAGRAGFKVDAVASDHSLDGLVAALVAAVG